MAGFLDRFRRRLTNERPLLRTHQPEYQDPANSVGSLVDHEGTLFVVTRWEELPRVPLNRGGSVREWQVYGRPADPAAVEAAIGRAAERILDAARTDSVVGPEVTPGSAPGTTTGGDPGAESTLEPGAEEPPGDHA